PRCGNPTPARSLPGACSLSASVGAPHVPGVAEAERTLGRFGEVEFAARDIRATVHDRDADRAVAVVKRHERPARKRLVGDAEGRAGQLAAAGQAAAAAVPGGAGEVVDVQPADPPA